MTVVMGVRNETAHTAERIAQRNSSHGECGDWTRSHHHFGSNRQAGRKLIGRQLHGDGQVAHTCGNRQVNAGERTEEVHHVDATMLAYHVAIVCG